MKARPRVWLSGLLIAGILCCSACGAGRVKTHPDPEVRLKSMRTVLESLSEDKGASEANQKKEEKRRGNEKTSEPSAK